MNKPLVVAPSPHIRTERSTSGIMRDVLIALIPAFVLTLFFCGADALYVTLIAVASCVGCEYLIQRFLLKGKRSIGDLSAVLTGVLLAFNLPATIPWWIVVLGSVFAIGVAKMSFGGLGRNPFNPAIAGRVFLLISFPAQMNAFPAPETDALSGATPLTYIQTAVKNNTPLTEVMHNFSYTDLLIGDRSGSLGEIAALALIAGFFYLLWRKVITWHIPVSILGSMFVFAGIMWLTDPARYTDPVFQLLTGGALLGAIYMATDYVTSPMSKKGMILYGIGIGAITILIRYWGSYPEGISFAILIMNMATPLIDKYIHPKRFGTKRKFAWNRH